MSAHLAREALRHSLWRKVWVSVSGNVDILVRTNGNYEWADIDSMIVMLWLENWQEVILLLIARTSCQLCSGQFRTLALM